MIDRLNLLGGCMQLHWGGCKSAQPTSSWPGIPIPTTVDIVKHDALNRYRFSETDVVCIMLIFFGQGEKSSRVVVGGGGVCICARHFNCKLWPNVSSILNTDYCCCHRPIQAALRIKLRNNFALNIRFAKGNSRMSLEVAMGWDSWWRYLCLWCQLYRSTCEP